MKTEQFIENKASWLQLEQELLTKQYQIKTDDYPAKIITPSFSLDSMTMYEVLCHYQQLALLDAFRQELGFEEQRYCLSRFTDNHQSSAYLPLLSYYVVNLRKYGASFEYLTVEELLATIKQLDIETYNTFITVGSGTLPQVESELVTCKANDVLATIAIHIKQETEEAYREAMAYLNTLLEKDFPKSYGIYYEGESDLVLPIEHLPITSSHHFFAKVLSYPSLHPSLVEYSYKAMAEYHFYQDVDEEEAAMPSTFAVFGLGLYDKSYSKLIIDYMYECDGDHSQMPIYFAKAYVETFGLTPETLPVFACTVTTVQEIPYDSLFEQAMNTEDNLQWFEQFMTTPFIKLCPLIPYGQSQHIEEYKDMVVAEVLYTCFGIIQLNDFESPQFMRIPEPYRTRFAAIIKELI
ncbi:DUF6138 family protein [Metasolibacillus meyeri]|uniref:DUF6138 family protein n=1 Tax=Metasolibacillus meyeri TaxID=1071052 RepID=A0AAW9NMZ9_9BACL|nr:DUF6138 family protein [Metasolibacillus meyeri]MEC1177822.1 DUF6138 family protein [Metasolibacillus meyeri]